MKAFTRIALALGAGIFSLGTAQAQTISNLNLETWAPRTAGGVEVPANWLTDDDLYSGGPFGTLTKSTDRNSGNFAARLSTDASGIGSLFALGASPGNPDNDLPGGVPFTGRPTQFQFSYKFSSAAAAADSALVIMALTRYNSTTQQQETIGFVQEVLDNPAAISYTRASFPVTYRSTATPDSLFILFISGIGSNITAGNAIFIDDVSIGAANPSATRNRSQDAAVSVSPNPSADGRFALTATEPALLASPYTVTDVTGRVVLQGAAASPAAARAIDLGTAAAGIYTLQLRTPNGVIARKLVVR